MVAIRAIVRVSRTGSLTRHVDKIVAALAGPSKVKVGFPAGHSPADITQIAIWQHFGTRGSGKPFSVERRGKVFHGFGGPIPPRPFITVAMFKARGEIKMNLRKIAHNVTVNGKPLTPELRKLGLYGANKIQDQIASNMGPPLAPITIEIKASSKTLIDSGRMRQSVTWALVPGTSVPRAGSRK